MNQFLSAKHADFLGVIDFFKKDIATLRTGRANPAMLDGVQVEVYGVFTPLNGVANISVADAKSMVISPWDKNVLKDVEKALIEANLGVGVVNEGDKIRLTIPAMTEENRKDLVKKINEKMEKSKISVRQLRDDVKTTIEEAESNKEIAEDDRFRFIKELDEEVNSSNETIKELRDKKEKEIMEI